MRKQTIKVLLVEDREADYFRIHEMLSDVKPWKFHLKWVSSFSDAEEELRSKNFDLCILDCSHFNQTGLKLAEILETNGQTAVILIKGPSDCNIKTPNNGMTFSLNNRHLNHHLLKQTIRSAVERAGAINALHKKENRLQARFVDCGIGIVLVDMEDGIIESNSAFEKMLGYGRNELQGKKLDELSHPDDLDKFGNLHKELTAGRKGHYQLQARCRRKDGRWIWCRLTVSPLKGELSRFAIGIAEDITERKLADEALSASENQIRLLSIQLLEAQAMERKLIAQELHDSIGANLTGIKYALEKKLNDAQMASTPENVSLDQIIAMVQSTIDEVRRISANMWPTIIDDVGILPTIDTLCHEFQGLHSEIEIIQGIRVQETDISESLKFAIYRILQEALHNVAKHSGAKSVRLSLRKKESCIELCIKDDGQGFNLKEVSRREKGLEGMGLASMKERAELAGGVFHIHSRKGAGTSIRASWPSCRAAATA